MDEKELALLTAVIGAAPGIAQWISGMLDGKDVDPVGTLRVRDVLPARSASEAAIDQIQRMQTPPAVEDDGT